MKRSIILCALAIASALTMSLSAAERGKFIHVDNTTSKNLKPQLAFCQESKDGIDITTLLVQTVDVNAYKEFTDASRVLLRFANGKVAKLPRVAGSEISKRKYSKKSGNATISYYETVSAYEVTPEVIEALENGIAVIKVRIVFKENDAKDYDIIEGYQERMAADLLKSYQEASLNNRKSHSDLSDEDF